MAVTKTESGVLITGDDIHNFAFRMGLRAIAMELGGSGMKMTRNFSAIEFAGRYGVKARTKRAALEGLVAKALEVDPTFELPSGVAKVLDK